MFRISDAVYAEATKKQAPFVIRFRDAVHHRVPLEPRGLGLLSPLLLLTVAPFSSSQGLHRVIPFKRIKGRTRSDGFATMLFSFSPRDFSVSDITDPKRYADVPTLQMEYLQGPSTKGE